MATSSRTPKPIDWQVLERGALGNNTPGHIVVNKAEHARWWRKAFTPTATFTFEFYATREEAQARVEELRGALARKLDADRARQFRSPWAGSNDVIAQAF